MLAHINSVWRALTTSTWICHQRAISNLIWCFWHWLMIINKLIPPFCQVAGEVVAEADDTPVFSIIDPIESILMGQGHLWICTYKEQTFFFMYHALYFNLLTLFCINWNIFTQCYWATSLELWSTLLKNLSVMEKGNISRSLRWEQN